MGCIFLQEDYCDLPLLPAGSLVSGSYFSFPVTYAPSKHFIVCMISISLDFSISQSTANTQIVYACFCSFSAWHMEGVSMHLLDESEIKQDSLSPRNVCKIAFM